MVYTCKFCNKDYLRKSLSKKHELICEIHHTSNRLLNCDIEENMDIPSNKKLYNLIQELFLQNKKLNEDVAELQKWINQKKKKLNVIEWLNENCIIDESITNWIANIKVSQIDIINFTTCSFVDSVNTILKNNLINIPIACFSEKINVFYVFKQQQSSLENKWIKMTNVDILLCIRRIHDKILFQLFKWREKNEKINPNNAKFDDIYNRTIIKLMSVDFDQDMLMSRTKTILFNLIKKGLHSFVDYEFEFE